MSHTTVIANECHYCHEACDEDKIVLQEKNYCCYGCATLDNVVAQIKNNSKEVDILYKTYDLPEIFDTLVDYQDDAKYRLRFSLPDIHCSSCIELLEDLPSIETGVIESRVNFENRSCTLTVSKNLAISNVAQLLDDIGYPPQLSLETRNIENQKKQHTSKLLKLTVAGFCFGNIMLFSMPHYFGLNVSNDPFFTALFKSLSVLLTLPVLLYSGRDFLTSAYKALTSGKAHLNIPIALGMVSLFAWSIYELVSGIGYGYLDSLAGLVFFLLIGKWFQNKVYDRVQFRRDVNEFIPMLTRKVMSDGKFEWIRLTELKKGDSILIKSNEIIPVNGQLQSGEALIDYSFITGESLPQHIDSSGIIYAGGRQQSGEIKITLNSKPSLDALWATWQTDKKESTEQDWTTRITKYFTWIIVTVAVLSAVAWFYIDASIAVFVFSAVLIVACPCALALSGPFTYGNITRIFSQNGLFVKDSQCIEHMATLNHVVFDKTGTLTEKNAISARYVGHPLTVKQKQAVASLVAQSNHPLSLIISRQLGEFTYKQIHRYKENIGFGIEGEVDGQWIQVGSSDWLNSGKNLEKQTSVYVSIDQKVIGHFNIEIAYRKGIENTLSALTKRFKLSVLSGDNDGQRNQLFSLFSGFETLKFNLNPHQKQLAINHIKKTENVLMVGDGLNDYKAIQSGTVGIAVTDSLNGFYPGAGAILLADSFQKLPAFLDLTGYSKKVLRISLVFALIYNIVGLGFAITGHLTPIVAAILMPLSSISIVALTTILVRIHAKKLNLL